MSLPLLLDDLAEQRIELRVEDGKLRYRAPEGALTPAWRERIAAHRDALLAHLSDQRPAEPEVLRCPATAAQQMIWFVDRMLGPNHVFNVPLTLRLRGALDPVALRAALNDMVGRQQSLRACFEYENEILHLAVRRNANAPWEELDISGLDEDSRRKRLDDSVRQVALHCFDLRGAPLLLARLIRIAPDEHVLALNVHHIVADGWSTGVMLQEIGAGYEARLSGSAAKLPSLKWEYTDYAAWQERLERDGSVDADLAFWRTRLAGAPEITTMPPDLPRPNVQNFAGSSVPFEIDRATAARLRAQARRWGASLSHVTLAATAILIAEFSGSRDLVIGLALANRTRRELEPLIGMFVNVVPIRLALAAEISAGELVRAVREASAGALEHCHAPFERLVEQIGHRRIPGANPVFQLAYNFLPRMETRIGFGGLQVEVFGNWSGISSSKNDCTFYLEESDGAVTGHIEYATGLYRRESVEGWAQSFGAILEAMLDDPAATIDALLRRVAPRPGALCCRISLPTDRPRPPQASGRSALMSFTADAALTAALQDLSQRSGVTLPMTLLAAWALLLGRYAEEDEVLIGSPVRGGATITVLHADLAADPSFAAILAGLRNTCPPGLARAQQFQVALLTTERQPAATPDLTLSIATADGTLAATLEYATDLFDAATIERLSRIFLQVLHSLVARPEQPIGELEIIPPEDKRQLLIDWNLTAAPVPERFLHQRFEAQAELTPDAAAVVFEGGALSYGELNVRANQLAHALIAAGAGPDRAIAIALERAPETIIAVLATLKAGAAWAPLDPAHPAGRLAFMFDDSGARILITRENLRSRLGLAAGHTLCLYTGWDEIARHPASNPNRTISPNDLAYIIYTSGSTGKPKGVAVEHRGVCNMAEALVAAFGVTPGSRVLQFASFSFDAAVAEIAMALYAGAELHLPNSEQRMPGLPLWQYLQDAAITHATLPPAALAALPRNPLPELKSLIVAGESCPPALAALWSRGRRFFNAYGPTEATVCATIAECVHADIDPLTALPIGRPIRNVQLYVMDRRGRPAPIGVPGELYVGGVGVARGYLNRPELTAASFLPDPFSGVPGDRLYRTGDLVRYRRDGSLEFLGRLDHQVKIRGCRIELGEIEMALAACPGIREAVVVARRASGAEQRLVAYVVPAAVQPSREELRSRLKASLPEYMLPTAWVFLPSFPLTPNGKVDRKALPEPEQRRPDACCQPPRDALERQLAEIWETLLQVRPIGMADDFFESGGHSLLAVRLAAEIEKRFGKRLPVKLLFEHRTISGIAPVLRQDGDAAKSSCLVRIRPHGTRPPLCFLPGIGGAVSYLYPFAQALSAEMPFFTFEAQGLDGKAEPHTSLEAMASHYVGLLLEAQPHGPYFLGGHSLGGRVAFAMAQLLLSRGHVVSLLAIVDSLAPGVMVAESAPEPSITEFTSHVARRFGGAGGQPKQPARSLETANDPQQSERSARLERLFKVYQANLRMIAEAPPTPSRRLPIMLFRARDMMAGLPPMRSFAEDLGWSQYSSRLVQIHYVSGDHETMMRPPHVRELARVLDSAIR